MLLAHKRAQIGTEYYRIMFLDVSRFHSDSAVLFLVVEICRGGSSISSDSSGLPGDQW